MRQLLGDRENISGLFVVFVVFLVAGVRSNLGVGGFTVQQRGVCCGREALAARHLCVTRKQWRAYLPSTSPQQVFVLSCNPECPRTHVVDQICLPPDCWDKRCVPPPPGSFPPTQGAVLPTVGKRATSQACPEAHLTCQFPRLTVMVSFFRWTSIIASYLLSLWPQMGKKYVWI